MNYEIEFKMIEIKDLSKIQKRKMVKDDIFEADVEQVEDIADEYCKDIMARIETLLAPDCKVKYGNIGEVDGYRKGRYLF